MRSIILPLLAACALAAQNNHIELQWNKPLEPHRVVGEIYYVGTNALASFLFATPQGLILLNSNYEESVPLIRASVERLGFHFRDIKYLLSSQAHNDHCAGNFLVKELTAARVLIMEGDDDVVANGGKGDFRWDGEISYKSCKVDRVLHDGDKVTLGGLTLVAHKTPGHTKGCTTWTTVVRENGRPLNLVIVGGTSVNPGVKLIGNASYPQINEDYERTFRVLRSLPCDIFLGAHGSYYGLDAKLKRLHSGASPNPFIDPQGYRAYIDEAEAGYRRELAAQRAAAR